MVRGFYFIGGSTAHWFLYVWQGLHSTKGWEWRPTAVQIIVDTNNKVRIKLGLVLV